MNKKIKQREENIVVKKFYINCPKCDKEITGTSAGQVDWNLKIHLEICKGNKK